MKSTLNRSVFEVQLLLKTAQRDLWKYFLGKRRKLGSAVRRQIQVLLAAFCQAEQAAFNTPLTTQVDPQESSNQRYANWRNPDFLFIFLLALLWLWYHLMVPVSAGFCIVAQRLGLPFDLIDLASFLYVTETGSYFAFSWWQYFSLYFPEVCVFFSPLFFLFAVIAIIKGMAARIKFAGGKDSL